MLTAKTSDDDIIQGLSLGADDYVAKPFSVWTTAISHVWKIICIISSCAVSREEPGSVCSNAEEKLHLLFQLEPRTLEER
jgi:CheY-like chemotaxis protein